MPLSVNCTTTSAKAPRCFVPSFAFSSVVRTARVFARAVRNP